MSIYKTKRIIVALIATLAIIFFALGIASVNRTAYADEGVSYGESYRNRLTFSAEKGWNNDPNGLVYADGVYHMYYQYNYDQHTGETANGWGNMSWGHTTSSDLVHWEEQSVAIPAYQNANGEWYSMMFSGSAVYDKDNTSGLFEVQDGTLKAGHGIVAVLTQPKWDEEKQCDVQRQILAYSLDGGYSFEIYGEILGADNDGGMGDNEFRDPKIFWSEEHNKWLMAVGGGLVRMYSSSNLLEWEYIGSTGFWGECPDLSCYEVNGQNKYVLVLSPEDKTNSHKYNGTTREEAFYPAEYYVVGRLNDKGLFVAESGLKRFSYGIDSYAFQSFNGSADGNVYGISWSASWKNVGEYEALRENYNGGMTLVTQLNLLKVDGEYELMRTPIETLQGLRGEQIAQYDGNLAKGENALVGASADIFELNATIDFNSSDATRAEVELRSSSAEKTLLSYNVESGILTLDRSQSSLLADATNYYRQPIQMPVRLLDGKLNFKIICDRAFATVFADGKAMFSAIFPSAISNGMKLSADGDVFVTASAYKLNGIFSSSTEKGGLILTDNKLDIVVGQTAPVVLSSFSEADGAENVTFTVADGTDNISLEQVGQTAYITALNKGFARVKAQCGDVIKDIEVFIYNDGYVGDIDYNYCLFGFTRPDDNGLVLSSGGDSFIFSETFANDFVYTADIGVNAEGQACGLMFGVSENYYDYFVATADFRYNVIKIWRAGVGDIATASYDFGGEVSCNMRLVVNSGNVYIYIDGATSASLICPAKGYKGGTLGFNTFNAEGLINNVSLKHINGVSYQGESDITLDFSGYTINKIINVTDSSKRLTGEQGSVENGIVTIKQSYLSTLEANSAYTIRIVCEEGEFDVIINTDFSGGTIKAQKGQFTSAEDIVFNIDGAENLYGLLLDGEKMDGSAYNFADGVVTISAEASKALVSGKHTIVALTSNGRPQTTFILAEAKVNVIEEEQPNHIFFYIDIAIFGTVIIGYVAITAINKHRAKKEV
ncbi:MAG: glycoside hydrolase family 32 protein [Candidatus Coproplasma sp.]